MRCPFVHETIWMRKAGYISYYLVAFAVGLTGDIHGNIKAAMAVALSRNIVCIVAVVPTSFSPSAMQMMNKTYM